MQPYLSVISETAGAVLIGGRLAGETDADRPLTLPVAPTGFLVLELRPFPPGYLPVCLHLTLAGGRPVISGPPDPRCFMAVWPDNLIELELKPEPISAHPEPIARIGDIAFSLLRPDRLMCLTRAGCHIHSLPECAQPPVIAPIPDGFWASGRTADGQDYALILEEGCAACALTVTGSAPELTEDGRTLRILRPFHDSVGHAQLETWTRGPDAWRLTGTEPMWADGSPAWPQTPEATAIAAIEAAQLGLMQEAASYFAPASSCTAALEAAARFDGCTPLRRPPLSGESAVGLIRLEMGRLIISPVRYGASRGGARGLWQLDMLETAAV